MMVSTTTRIPAALALAIAVASAGCDELRNALSPSRDVTYHVTGSGPASLITYASSDGATSQRSDQTLPWQSFMSGAQKDQFAYVSAQKGTGAGCITAEIKVDGKTVETATSCGAFAIATASGTLK